MNIGSTFDARSLGAETAISSDLGDCLDEGLWADSDAFEAVSDPAYDGEYVYSFCMGEPTNPV